MEHEIYQSYAEEEGSGGWVEQGWSGDEVPRRVVRGKEGCQKRDDEEADFAGKERYGADLGQSNAGVERARDDLVTINAAGAQEGVAASIMARVNPIPDQSADELARRRKGKEIQIQSDVGPRLGGGHIGPTQNSSGSDSCDPLESRAQLKVGPVSSDDADSGCGPGTKMGLVKEKPILISEGTDEDVDMGGEGGVGGRYSGQEVEGLRAPKTETADKIVASSTKEVAEEEGRDRFEEEEMQAEGGGAGEENAGARSNVDKEGSKGSSVSVPPGFQRMHGLKSKGVAGASSPFGKLQRGGFKFLKKSVSTASSGAKSGQAQAKKNRPISALPNQDITEVANNVGIVEQLSEQQISRLKSREKDQASS